MSAAKAYAEKQEALAADYLERARAIAPLVENEAEATERGGRITRAVHEAFAASNLYWMLIPEELGGPGLGAVGGIQVTEEIARADGSSGWSFMANAFTNAAVAGHISDEGAHALWGGAKKGNTCGQFAPNGTGVDVEGGVRGGGRYKFGSGSAYADWIVGGIIIQENGKPCILDNGRPDMRVLNVPMERVKLCGNWDVIGLVGTGSVDYEITDQFVPSHLVMAGGDPLAVPRRGGPLLHLGGIGLAASGHLGVALGIAKRALQEIAEIVHGKTRQGFSAAPPIPIHEHPVFRHEFAIQEAAYQSARIFALDVFAAAEATIANGGQTTEAQRARLRQACSLAHKMSSEVVAFCHHWGASQSFRNPTALGRCTRDAAVMTQHIIVDETAWSECVDPIYRTWLRGKDEAAP
jgi:alkylation response protein AidB-like acyl-CoA dehydrogenase